MAFVIYRRIRDWLSVRRFWCNLVAATVAITIFAPLTYWTIDRTPPYDLTNGYIIPSPVKPGETFYISWDLRKLTNPVEGYAQVRIIDSQKGITYMAAEHSTIGIEGKIGDVNRVQGRARVMPERVACGPATIQVHSTYFGNPVRTYLWPVRVDRPPLKVDILCTEPLVGPQGPQGIQGERGEQGPKGD